MGYVVVVFAIINTLALVGVAMLLVSYSGAILESVETAIQDEVRKQDDRIEKRLAKAKEPAGNEPGTVESSDGMRPGVPWRR